MNSKQPLLLSIVFCLCFTVMGRAQQMDVTVPFSSSPDIAGLLKDYQVSNDYFNGKVNIAVPVFSYNIGGIKVPVSVSYNGGGIPIDQVPSVVGLGWNLNAGGYITRIPKGQADEMWPLKYHTYYIFGTPPFTAPEKATDKSYLTNHGMLDRSDWSATSFLNTLNTNSGYTEVTTGIVTTNANPLPDLQPDEFVFSVNGMSGKFALDHMGRWICKSDAEGVSFQITPVLREEVKMNENKAIVRAFVQFILTANDGTKYYFGEDTAEYPENIEYSYPSTVHMAEDYNGGHAEIAPSTWRLQKIVTPSGATATFSYKTWGLQSQKSKHYYGSSQANPMLYFNTVAKTLTQTWYLDKITGSDGTLMEFQTAAATQLGTNDDITSDGLYFFGMNNVLPPPPQISSKNIYPKLEQIRVSFNGSLVKKTTFNYIENINERLKLEYIKFEDINGQLPPVQYKFVYNPNKLPVYASGKEDHWGFFNDNNFFASTPPPYTYNQILTDYTASRAPDFGKTKYEILEKMILPTGAETEFEYEPHSYSKFASLFPFIVTDENTNKAAGGVRIKKVTIRDNGNIVKQTEYVYERAGSSLSSGVLSAPLPKYLLGNTSEFTFESINVEGSGIRASGVSYTRVIEKELNNGYTEYVYKNFDNEGNDVAPIVELPTGTHNWVNDNSYTSLSEVRGKLRFRRVYVNGETDPVEETEYSYTYSSAPRKLRAVSFVPEVRWPVSTAAFRAAAYEADFTSDLERVTVTRRRSQGIVLEEVVEKQHDDYNNPQTIKTSNSNGRVARQRFRYAYNYGDFGTDLPSLGINKLMAAGARGQLIEKISTTEDANGTNVVVTDGELYYYKADVPLLDKVYNLKAGYTIPYTSFTTSIVSGASFTRDSRYADQPELVYDLWDSRGNALQKTERGTGKQSFQWGYNNMHAVAKVVHAENTYAENYVPATKSGSIQATVSGATSFTTYYPGSITFEILHTGAPSKSFYINCSLSGAYTENFQLCFPFNQPQSTCGVSTYTFTLPNMPAGTYNLAVNPANYPQANVTFTYQGRNMVTSGIKDFYYEGFEEHPAGSTSIVFAGKKAYPGDFTASFTRPTSQRYFIDYYYYDGSVWKYMKKSFTSNTMLLTEGTAIDEVRIYPEQARMETYTYDPMTGITSIMDPAGNVRFFEYDGLKRLSIVRDRDKKIIKKVDYTYQVNP